MDAVLVSIPTPYVLQVKRSSLTTNAHNEQVRSWGSPVDWPVHSYAPGDNSLPASPNRDESEILWTVYAPADENLPVEFDKVTLGGDDYLVAAHPGDWSHGPWDFPEAGAAVLLKRTEG